MLKQALIITGFIFLAIWNSFSQTGVVKGYVSNEEQTPVEYVNLAVKGTTKGTTTNKQGYFELMVPANQRVVILLSFVGFEKDSLVVNLTPGETKDVELILKPTSTELSTIEVKDAQLRTSTFSRIDPKTISIIPTINASIEDIIKTLPGVSSQDELSSQYSVRGGNYDENLVFVNDIEIYRPFLIRSGQQEGMSFLNPDLVSSILFSAGGFDAKYGNKMASVLDIRYRKPQSFAGSVDISLMGASAHLEGTFARKRFSYLLGTRYKTNTYFLKSLDTKGNYKPRYFDIQGMLYYDVSEKVELSVLGYYSNNVFKLIPETRETSFGTLDEAYKIKVYFDGHEVDRYQNWLSALTLTYRPIDKMRLRFIASVYQTNESETYDISGEYWIGRLETFQSSSEYGEITQLLGVGAYMDHARNYLNGTVFNVEHRGSLEKNINKINWGIRYQYSYFENVMNEWELQDSAGYTLPHPRDSIGDPNPVHDPFVLKNVIKTNQNLNTSLISAFAQDTWTFKLRQTDIALTAGVRGIWYDYNGQFNVNPRVNLSFKPHWKTETVFRISSGYYSQPPTFREMTDLEGNVVSGLKSQTSIQVLAGSDLYFKAWGRHFKFVAEAYYKYIKNLIPYEIDNLNIRYYGTNDAHGYATGIDFRINGEFVKGAESWVSLSIMKTEEFFQGEWIPRPTDQRLNLSVFFQDYVPKLPMLKVAITLFYGTGLPVGPPDSPRKSHTLRIPDYKRVDLGISYALIGERTRFKNPKNILRAFKSMWISLEIFNLLQLSNTIS
ncbi:MAG: carboxypeptidase-like regulatory domain-containing protein, partial [Bacteroidetes bacterium]|nr:carboxypeptidase-like regulatory domain-containing protein [Bacteroidota bacterium]